MLIHTPRDLGLLVRDARRARQLSQAALAALAGVGREWVITFEKGNPGAEVGRVLRAMRVLELAVDVAPAAASAKRVRETPSVIEQVLARTGRKPAR